MITLNIFYCSKRQMIAAIIYFLNNCEYLATTNLSISVFKYEINNLYGILNSNMTSIYDYVYIITTIL